MYAPIVGQDNTGALELIESKPMGILALLDEECYFPKGTDHSYVYKMHTAFESHQFYAKPMLKLGCFTVKHFAGDVLYDSTGFLVKCTDKLENDLETLINSSTLQGINMVSYQCHIQLLIQCASN